MMKHAHLSSERGVRLLYEVPEELLVDGQLPLPEVLLLVLLLRTSPLATWPIMTSFPDFYFFSIIKFRQIYEVLSFISSHLLIRQVFLAS